MKNIVKKASMMAMLAVVGFGLAACESTGTTQYPREHYEDWQKASGAQPAVTRSSARVFKSSMDK